MDISQNNRELFVYGTLQIPQVLELLIGRVPAMRTARVAQWRASPLMHDIYPGLVVDHSDQGYADGVVLQEITAEELAVFDAFEGPQYCRSTVETINGSSVATYVLADPTTSLPGIWTLTTFVNSYLDDYLTSCRQWLRHVAGE